METRDATSRTPTTSVIRAVAETSDTAPTDLPPLYDTLDSDALDAFVGDADTGSELDFHYYGTRVTITVLDEGCAVDVAEAEPGRDAGPGLISEGSGGRKPPQTAQTTSGIKNPTRSSTATSTSA